jgi:hypothetical protein
MRELLSTLLKLLGVKRPPELPSLTKQQQEILQILRNESRKAGSDEFTYQSEWLGWLPYGQYHGVNVQGTSVSNQFPSGWDLSDLDALVAFGLAEKLEERTSGEGETDSEILYRLLREPTCD